MKIFTFMSKRHNYNKGEYDFVAEQWTTAVKMATNFEKEFNKRASNSNYTINLDTDIHSVRVILIEPGFVNIRGRGQ